MKLKQLSSLPNLSSVGVGVRETSALMFVDYIHNNNTVSSYSVTLNQVKSSISSHFVTLDTAQTITGQKTFTQNTILQTSYNSTSYNDNYIHLFGKTNDKVTIGACVFNRTGSSSNQKNDLYLRAYGNSNKYGQIAITYNAFNNVCSQNLEVNGGKLPDDTTLTSSTQIAWQGWVNSKFVRPSEIKAGTGITVTQLTSDGKVQISTTGGESNDYYVRNVSGSREKNSTASLYLLIGRFKPPSTGTVQEIVIHGTIGSWRTKAANFMAVLHDVSTTTFNGEALLYSSATDAAFPNNVDLIITQDSSNNGYVYLYFCSTVVSSYIKYNLMVAYKTNADNRGMTEYSKPNGAAGWITTKTGNIVWRMSTSEYKNTENFVTAAWVKSLSATTSYFGGIKAEAKNDDETAKVKIGSDGYLYYKPGSGTAGVTSITAQQNVSVDQSTGAVTITGPNLTKYVQCDNNGTNDNVAIFDGNSKKIKSSGSTLGNGKLTIQKNGSALTSFTANSSSNVTCNITVPTKVSELTNDSGYTTNKGTITEIKMNGSSKGTSGVVDLGTVLTAQANNTTLGGIKADSKLIDDTVPVRIDTNGKLWCANGSASSSPYFYTTRVVVRFNPNRPKIAFSDSCVDLDSILVRYNKTQVKIDFNIIMTDESTSTGKTIYIYKCLKNNTPVATSDTLVRSISLGTRDNGIIDDVEFTRGTGANLQRLFFCVSAENTIATVGTSTVTAHSHNYTIGSAVVDLFFKDT